MVWEIAKDFSKRNTKGNNKIVRNKGKSWRGTKAKKGTETFKKPLFYTHSIYALS